MRLANAQGCSCLQAEAVVSEVMGPWCNFDRIEKRKFGNGTVVIHGDRLGRSWVRPLRISRIPIGQSPPSLAHTNADHRSRWRVRPELKGPCWIRHDTAGQASSAPVRSVGSNLERHPDHARSAAATAVRCFPMPGNGCQELIFVVEFCKCAARHREPGTPRVVGAVNNFGRQGVSHWLPANQGMQSACSSVG